jgi:hypothetical protein
VFEGLISILYDKIGEPFGYAADQSISIFWPLFDVVPGRIIGGKACSIVNTSD